MHFHPDMPRFAVIIFLPTSAKALLSMYNHRSYSHTSIPGQPEIPDFDQHFYLV